MSQHPSSFTPGARSGHILRQLKLVIPGAAVTYYLDVCNELSRLAREGSKWGRTVALTSVALGVNTIALFLYVLAIHVFKGEELNYHAWQESTRLSVIIPILTASIVIGWSLLVLTLGHFTSLGYIEGFIGAGALYLLGFGLMGLIPAPRSRRLS